ncbi:MAG TPA: preprotein translocase subunit YajC [Bacteroidales bacterium]|nr:preprotein translocase subunit YajC [Bacteroidales bacterium]
MDIISILLFAPPAEGQQGGGFMSFLPLILIMVVFYFFFIRPQMRKAKEQKQFRESLKKGDKIITIGGVHGKVSEVRETTLIIEVANDVRIEVEKSAVVSDPSQVGTAAK